MIRHLITATLCITLLVGCSQGPRIPQGNATFGARFDHKVAGSRAKASYIFVANIDNSQSEILIFTDSVIPTLVNTISSGISSPGQIAFDDKNTLYVANGSNNTVSEYAAGSLKPTVVISNGLHYPAGVAVATDDTLYVSNNQTPSTIAEIKPGATKPSKEIRGIAHPLGLALNASNDLYVAAEKAGVFEISSGASKPVKLALQGVSYAIGLAVDPAGNLYVGNCTGGYYGSVLVYRSKGTKPFREIRAPQGSECPRYLNISSDGFRIFWPSQGGVAVYKLHAKQPYLTFSTDMRNAESASAASWPTL